MPTARELLEQADALMKRNRALAEQGDIPELTDVVPEGELGAGPPAAAGADEAWHTGGTLGDADPGVVADTPTLQGEPSAWLDEVAKGAASITGQPPDSVIVVPPPLSGIDAAVAATATAEAPGPSGGLAADLARWEALADEIRMQVLQRIDLFTDTGLKQQLLKRLQPAVDRASAELVGTISDEIGQLLRAYVAEAIELEIERWRKGPGAT
jgi:hypothetical protein